MYRAERDGRSHGIFTGGHRLKVPRIHAGPDPAEMVALKVVGDWADEVLVTHSVGQLGGLIRSKVPVAAARAGTYP